MARSKGPQPRPAAMTTTTVTPMPPAPRPRALLGPTTGIWAAALLVLLVVLFHSFVARTARFAQDADWSHVAVIPLISLFFVYQRREKVFAAPKRVYWPGALLFVFGIAASLLSINPIRNDMAMGYSIILTIAGLGLFLLGPAAMRPLWFPVAYLVFAVKVSDQIWSRIAAILQDIAAKGATGVLMALGLLLDFTVGVRGNTIDIFSSAHMTAPAPMNVAEACSGLRMLMAFMALGVAMAFMWERPAWQRILMIALAAPIAVGVNIARVTILGLLFIYQPGMAQGSFHTFVGMLMLIPAALLFMLVGWILDRLVIDDGPAPPDDGPGVALAAAPAGSWPRWPAALLAPGLALAVALIAIGLWRDRPEPTFTGVLGSAYVAAGLAAAALVLTLAAVKQRSAMVLGLALGGVGIALLGLAYGLGLSWIELANNGDDPLSIFTAPWQAVAALALVAGVAAVAAVLAPKLARRWGGAHGLTDTRVACGFVAGALAMTIVGQSTVIAWTGTVLIKKPLPLRHNLLTVAQQAGPWEMAHEQPPLSPEVLETLGTRDYFTRMYVDTEHPQAGGPFAYDVPNDPSQKPRVNFDPGSLLRLHTAYYTGTVDTVPHVPTRCFIAGGAEHLGVEQITLDLDPQHFTPAPNGEGYLGKTEDGRTVYIPTLQIPATKFQYLMEGADAPEYVVFFFAANGKFIASPNGVRANGFDPTDQYSYYCKIEAQPVLVQDPALAKQRVEAMLTHLLPEVMACLPDWREVEARKYPTTP
ncbi:MAG: exosortase/archaeosortase family protein [Planctomycetota bacterium]